MWKTYEGDFVTLESFLECFVDREVGDVSESKGVFPSRVKFEDLFALGWSTDGCCDGVVLLDEKVDDMRGH